MRTKKIFKLLHRGGINIEWALNAGKIFELFNFCVRRCMYRGSPMWLIGNFLNKFFLVFHPHALKSPDEYLIKCTKANIFDRADVLTAFFTYKLLCATVRQRYFCICDKKDVPKIAACFLIILKKFTYLGTNIISWHWIVLRIFIH